MKPCKRIMSIILSITLIISIIPALSMSASAAEVFTLNPDREIDNLEMLPAGAADRSSGLGLFNGGVPKYFWVTGFGSGHYMEWTVSSPAAASYVGWLHISTGSACTYNIAVTQGETTTNSQFTTTGKGWEKAEVGPMQIPQGVSTIRLTRTSGTANATIKGLDMIRESDLAAYNARVADFKSNTEWFSKTGYGLFFQYGVWGYPQFGAKKSAEDATNDFDVEDFVNLVEATGAKYVIWSLTWWQYRMQMPVQAVDDIMGHSDFTTERNLVGEIAEACNEKGIAFFLYYHQGIQQEPTWKAKQNWPDGFTQTGTGNRDTFFSNWEAVISEIGETLGENLNGWYFDDGCVYWPAPFERLGVAAKKGNPNRILAYNDWTGSSVTDFQESTFGENGWGEYSADTPTDANGILLAGKDKGLLHNGMPMLERENWGIEHQNQTITLNTTSATVITRIKSAMSRNVPVSLNLQMWEDGTVGQDTLKLLMELKKAVRTEEKPANPKELLINDDDARIMYSDNTGSPGKWSHETNYPDNIGGDIHKNTDPEASPTVTMDFKGTGIEMISDRGSWGQKFDVFIKKQADPEFDVTPTGSGTMASGSGGSVVLYSKKDLPLDNYTIKVVFSRANTGANEAHLDAFMVYNDYGDDGDDPDPEYPATSITITAPEGGAQVGPGNTLQMRATVRPQYATVKWSVTDIEGGATTLATINEDSGLLTAGSLNGTVKVTCASSVGSVSDSMEIEIKKQPQKSTVLGDDKDITRSGSWTIRTGTCDSTSVGASATYTFEGESIEWYGVKGNDHGIASVTIDGGTPVSVDCYAVNRSTDTLLFSSGPLDPGTHTIRIQITGRNASATNSYIEVYRFVIGLSAPAITTESLPDGIVGTAYSQILEATGNTPITWSVTGGNLPDGLSLNENGVISGTPTAVGTSNFTVKATNSVSSDTKELSITISEAIPTNIDVTGVSLDKDTLELTVGDTTALTATVEPDDATNKAVTWTSNDEDVATVDSDGNVEAIAPGTAIITVITEDGEFTAACKVTVKAKFVEVTSVKIDGAAIQQVRIRNTKQFTATVNPTDATDQSVTWESSNPKIFTVDEEGFVKGVGTGSAKLIVTCGDKTSFIMVQITA